jgi:hypothetical protein
MMSRFDTLIFGALMDSVRAHVVVIASDSMKLRGEEKIEKTRTLNTRTVISSSVEATNKANPTDDELNSHGPSCREDVPPIEVEK